MLRVNIAHGIEAQERRGPGLIDEERLQPYPHCWGWSLPVLETVRHVSVGPPPGAVVKGWFRHWCARYPDHEGDHVIPKSLTEVERVAWASVPKWARGPDAVA